MICRSQYVDVLKPRADKFCHIERNISTSMDMIVMKASYYFTKVVPSSRSLMCDRLKCMVDFFGLDRETFLLSVIIFHRYMEVASLLYLFGFNCSI
jgi:hypothetical protein